MCGRLTTTHSPTEAAEAYGVASVIPNHFQVSYNVAPSQMLLTVLAHVTDHGEVTRELVETKWGLVPSWAKDPSIGNKMINARLETAAEKPAFRKAYQFRRCIITASGYYEWQVVGKQKQPWYIYPADNSILGLAGLYETWTDAEGKRLMTSTILTTDAPGDDGQVHDRAPLIVPSQHVATWLSPSGSSTEGLVQMLTPAVPGVLASHKVGPEVGNVKNDDASLIAEQTAPTRLF